MKTTPIPVKFDRQGHSCNFYAAFGPTIAKPQAPTSVKSNKCYAQRKRRHITVIIVSVWGPMILPSQRSLHYAPIFRLLLKVAVNGTHQCDFLNFCEPLRLNCCFDGHGLHHHHARFHSPPSIRVTKQAEVTRAPIKPIVERELDLGLEIAK